MFNIIFSLTLAVTFGLIIFILKQQVKHRKEIDRLQRTSDKLSSRIGVCTQRIMSVDLQVAKLVGEVVNQSTSTK